jgi:hypothetical protein
VWNHSDKIRYFGTTYGTIAGIRDLGLLQTVRGDLDQVIIVSLDKCGKKDPTITGIVWLKLCMVKDPSRIFCGLKSKEFATTKLLAVRLLTDVQ